MLYLDIYDGNKRFTQRRPFKYLVKLFFSVENDALITIIKLFKADESFS
jgi:hypothetical protein